MKLAGLVLDVYDDVDKSQLAAFFAYAPPGEKLANAKLASPKELARLPDHVFALVATNHGETIRKYAMHDEANLKLSIVYFAQNGHHLPEETQKIAARNLIRGCDWYDVRPPDLLKKVAFAGAVLNTVSLGATAKQGMNAHRQAMQQFRNAQAAGAQAVSPATLSAGQGAARQPGAVAGAMPGIPKVAEYDYLDDVLGLDKEADLTDTEIMPLATLKSKKTKILGASGGPVKTSSLVSDEWESAGDLTNFNGHRQVKVAKAKNYCFPHVRKYPIDTFEQVKTASRYFDEHWPKFTPGERRVYADNLVKRAQDLNLPVSRKALEYAGEGYGPRIEAELIKRAEAFAGTGKDVGYRTLLEKRAHIPAHVMASLLTDMDTKLGADRSYGRPVVGFLDPYAAVYGGREKRASVVWSDDEGELTEQQMLDFAVSPKGDKLKEAFGDSFFDSFLSEPAVIFKSMPDPQKAVIAKIIRGS